MGGHKESGSTGLHAVTGKFKGHLPTKLKVVSLENYYLYWKVCEGYFFLYILVEYLFGNSKISSWLLGILLCSISYFILDNYPFCCNTLTFLFSHVNLVELKKEN